MQAESLQAQIKALAADKAISYEARVHAETRLAALEAELSSTCSELETAKHTGTPKGELASCVAVEVSGSVCTACCFNCCHHRQPGVQQPDPLCLICPM